VKRMNVLEMMKEFRSSNRDLGDHDEEQDEVADDVDHADALHSTQQHDRPPALTNDRPTSGARVRWTFLNIFIHRHMLIATNENKQHNNLN